MYFRLTAILSYISLEGDNCVIWGNGWGIHPLLSDIVAVMYLFSIQEEHEERESQPDKNYKII